MPTTGWESVSKNKYKSFKILNILTFIESMEFYDMVLCFMVVLLTVKHILKENLDDGKKELLFHKKQTFFCFLTRSVRDSVTNNDQVWKRISYGARLPKVRSISIEINDTLWQVKVITHRITWQSIRYKYTSFSFNWKKYFLDLHRETKAFYLIDTSYKNPGQVI